MEVLLVLLGMLLFNLFSFALPALVAAWLFSLILPIAFNQALWLSLGALIIMEYTIQTITDIPGQAQYGLIQMILSVVLTYLLLALSAFFGWALLQVFSVDLTIFESTLLFSISLAAGFFFLARSGTVGFPSWLTLSTLDLEDEDFEEDYITPPPPPKPAQSKRKSRRRRVN
jgi:hypothetical protein